MTLQTLNSAGKVRKLPVRRARIEDDLVADFIAMVVKPGDRTLQIGADEIGAECLRRGARHDVIAPLSEIDGFQAVCDRRSIPTDALRGGPTPNKANDEGPLALAIISARSGFPALAGHWRHVASHLAEGGVLVLLGADTGASARLADALMSDEAWALQDRIGGDTAVFRKRKAVTATQARASLESVSSPTHKSRGVGRADMMTRVRAFLTAGRGPAKSSLS
ncbi:hypothetical protein [Maricaulis sp. CAU 1757]